MDLLFPAQTCPQSSLLQAKRKAYTYGQESVCSAGVHRSSYHKKKNPSKNINFERLRQATFSQLLGSLIPSALFCGCTSEIKQWCWMRTAEHWKGASGQFPSRFCCWPVGMCSVSLLPFPKENKKAKNVRSFMDTRKSEPMPFVLESLLQAVICHLQGTHHTWFPEHFQIAASHNPPPTITCLKGGKCHQKNTVYCVHSLQSALWDIRCQVHAEHLQMWKVGFSYPCQWDIHIPPLLYRYSPGYLYLQIYSLIYRADHKPLPVRLMPVRYCSLLWDKMKSRGLLCASVNKLSAQ